MRVGGVTANGSRGEVAVSGGEGIYMPWSIYMLECIHVGSKSRRPGDGPYRVDGGMGETAQ